MDGRGGCCIARYVGGSYDMSKVDRIMLRFRPIAPKPAGPVSSIEKSDVTVKNGGRGKRKYNSKDSSTTKRYNRKKTKASPASKKGDVMDKVVTLPLLPEKPEWKECLPVKRNVPVWLSFENGSFGSSLVLDRPVVSVPQPIRTVASCVTVEHVTDTWAEGGTLLLGLTDEERRRNLERDTCPGFISDGVGKVTWTNEAYMKMVIGESSTASEMRVWLVMKERPPVTWTERGGGLKYPAFTCRVKVEYTCRKEKNTMTVPCDVWRMEGGGFAWRLDVKAALSLSLGR